MRDIRSPGRTLPVRPTVDLWERARPLLAVGLLVALPVCWTLDLLVTALVTDAAGWDLKLAYLPASHAVLDGQSPYPGLGDASIAGQYAYVYPPLLAWALVPLTLVDPRVAVLIAVLGLILAVLGTLWVCGVRDLRCYGVVFAWPAVYGGIVVASVSILLALLIAIGWRLVGERRLAVGGVVLGVVVAVKIFLWPLALLLVANHRVRPALALLATTIVSVGVSWAAIGFAGLASYPALLHRLAQLEQDESVSIVSVVTGLGRSVTTGQIVAIVLGAVLLASSWRSARSGARAVALLLAIASAIVLSPIVWQHYFVLLIVPLALLRPRFSWVWLLPIVGWPQYWDRHYPPWLFLLAAGIAILVAVPAAFARGHGAEATSSQVTGA